MSVSANLAAINETLGDKPVKLIAVTKKASLSQIEQAFEAGVTEFGENRIQEAMKKRQELSPSTVQGSHWHFIGHLQTNKAKTAVGNFALIHSVDSLKLARELSRLAVARELVQPVLLQVKVVEDSSKGGFAPDSLRQEFGKVITLAGIEVRGLMTITPLTDDAEIRKLSFEGLRALRDELAAEHGVELKELSMGMTDDWREAIEYGATMVRIGRAIFGTN